MHTAPADSSARSYSGHKRAATLALTMTAGMPARAELPASKRSTSCAASCGDGARITPAAPKRFAVMTLVKIDAPAPQVESFDTSARSPPCGDGSAGAAVVEGGAA